MRKKQDGREAKMVDLNQQTIVQFYSILFLLCLTHSCYVEYCTMLCCGICFFFFVLADDSNRGVKVGGVGGVEREGASREGP